MKFYLPQDKFSSFGYMSHLKICIISFNVTEFSSMLAGVVITDHSNMTLDVYRGLKTTTQQQLHVHLPFLVYLCQCKGELMLNTLARLFKTNDVVS